VATAFEHVYGSRATSGAPELIWKKLSDPLVSLKLTCLDQALKGITDSLWLTV